MHAGGSKVELGKLMSGQLRAPEGCSVNNGFSTVPNKKLIYTTLKRVAEVESRSKAEPSPLVLAGNGQSETDRVAKAWASEGAKNYFGRDDRYRGAINAHPLVFDFAAARKAVAKELRAGRVLRSCRPFAL
jgi:hypothetical protein